MTEVEQLRAEVERLKAAIREHRDQRGDDRCWLDDHTLYAKLDEGIPADGTALPPKEDFLRSCERYYEQRRCPLDKYPPGKMRIAELEAEVSRLRAELAALESEAGRIEAERDAVIRLCYRRRSIGVGGPEWFEATIPGITGPTESEAEAVAAIRSAAGLPGPGREGSE